ncbi:patatin-like phospholipase family protein [Flavobacterium sp. S87F.05.LMB.W.Kidney.N]|uniref:patatin-like phospholipase family protein n=1 Tax=Flavobacterium sp. S87F.05.LMB.W.Kidney.N TaxID=1278758 RepID=UPI0010CFCB45|nr:patatin-like phospholipase family protein [Flavobacterium sp. S87F.05.LMB.W.Kidney.N]TDX11230.1 NTE family protein [Flavobacterium sp. S87F.05.LMB.W.Kidney.N]
MKEKFKIGLALSGGGYRAAAFHLGVFRKLNEMKILENLDVISTISGGSIIGTYYALNKGDFENFEKSFTQKLQKSCIRKILLSTRFLTTSIILLGYVSFLLFDPLNLQLPKWLVNCLLLVLVVLLFIFPFKIFPLTKLKIKAYKSIFFGKSTISDLPSKPLLAINATNLSTGTLFTFSRRKCSDSSYEYIKDGGKPIGFNCSKMPVAIAVASSTCVPVPFGPVEIDRIYFESEKDKFRVKPKLIDGGLYDNQGIHKLTQKNSTYSCDILIVSDGSQPFTGNFLSFNTVFILYRALDVMMRKIKNLQFIRDVYSADKEIAYFSLNWKYKSCLVEFVRAAKNNQISQIVLDYHEVDEDKLNLSIEELYDYLSKKIGLTEIIKNGLIDEQIDEISRVGTNLTALKKETITRLSTHGEVLTEILIKLYCPTLAKLL